MIVSGSIHGQAVMTRKFRIGATVTDGQIVIWDGATAPTGEVTDPTAEGAANAIGITYEAGTYATASPPVFVKCSCDPFQIIRGRASGGTANNTAFPTSMLLTQATASTTVIADVNVGTLEYSGGYIIGLTGANRGHIRKLTSQVDSTSCTVAVAFASTVAVNDTLLRMYAPLIRNIEITATWDQFNALLTGTEDLTTAAANGAPIVIWDTYVDDQSCAQSNFIGVQNPTAPIVEHAAMFTDHALARHTA